MNILARVLFLFLVFKHSNCTHGLWRQKSHGDSFCGHPEGGKEKQISACSTIATTPVKLHWGQVSVARIRMRSHQLAQTKTTSAGVFVKGCFYILFIFRKLEQIKASHQTKKTREKLWGA